MKGENYMAVAQANSTIAAFNTVTAVTTSLATSVTDALAEVFTVTPTVSGGKLLIVFHFSNLLATLAADSDATFSIAAGDLWAGKVVTGTIAKATNQMIQVETASVLQDDGTILITLTPSATDSLKTNHAAGIQVFELL